MEKKLEKQFIESVNRLAVRITQEKNSVLSFSSIDKHEGTSTIVYNLAKVLQEMNNRVIVLDTNMSKTSKKDNLSLVDYLEEKAKLEDIILNEQGIAVIESAVSEKSKTLLSSEKFSALVSLLKQTYDFVLIDTSPMSESVDSILVGRISDGMIFIVEANKHSSQILQEQVQTLKRNGISVIGTVLSKSQESM
ncbi:MAG: CpsD/CapB family tyrosine-protein kinase [Erysipelothrix sp.]|nr:CpsD/CapB family tyrosine-protein kinase [Erysipelothrix sp.]